MKKTTIKMVILGLVLTSLFVFVPIVLGQGLPQVPQVPGQVTTPFGTTGALTVRNVVLNILSILLAVAGFIAVLFVIYGGYQYLTAGGNEKSVEAAKKILTNAIIGLVVIVLSYAILVVIENVLIGTV